MGKLSGKVAVVIGAGAPGNMGQAIARRLAADGAKVVVAARKLEGMKALAEEIGGVMELCDVTSRESADALVKAILDRFGRLDIAVNAAGISVTKPILETTREELQAILDTNFIGPFMLMQSLVNGMANGGSIIQITSATATVMMENHAAYMGAKAGFDHALRAMANEFGSRGLRINSVSPGLTNTPMAAGLFQIPAAVELFRREYPLGRIGTSEDIAAACSWLSQDDCFMTGQTLQVNGGLTLRRNPRWDEVVAAFG